MGSISKIGYVIVFVRDMERATAFYRDAIGLELGEASPGWTEFKLEGTTLALHVNPALPPVPAPLADPSEIKGVPQEIVFHASDPLAVRASLASRGINVAKPKVVHEAGPDQVGISCMFEDVDGNRLSVYGIAAKSSLDESQ